MSASRSARRPEGPGVRRPSRDGHLTTDRREDKGKLPPRRHQTHPDFPAPEPLPLFDAVPRPAPPVVEWLRGTGTAVEYVDVQGVPHRAEPVLREPGDEARAIVLLTPPGGHPDGPATVADCGVWYECDCAEYRRDWQCRHIFALIRVGRLTDPLAASRGRDGRPKGGASC